MSGIVDHTYIDSWGYELSSTTKYMSEFCAGSQSPITSEYQSIRSLKKSPELPVAFYRFTIGKEVYGSTTGATRRVAEIRKPENRSSKQSKLCDIRDAVSVGEVIYFVHTDVGIFRKELRNILDKLSQCLSNGNDLNL